MRVLQRYTSWSDGGGKGGEIVCFGGGAGAGCRVEVVGCISSEQNVWSPRFVVVFILGVLVLNFDVLQVWSEGYHGCGG